MSFSWFPKLRGVSLYIQLEPQTPRVQGSEFRVRDEVSLTQVARERYPCENAGGSYLYLGL